MKYFIDTEFIEGFRKSILGKKRHFIDLISIGIVREDGKSYYAISNEFKPQEASQWVRDNVISKIIIPKPISEFKYEYNSDQELHTWYDDKVNGFVFSAVGLKSTGYGKFKNWHNEFCPKSNKQIAREIREFIYHETMVDWDGMCPSDWFIENSIKDGYFKPEFYGYYADYDWVLFCSLFGTMMDLPKGFPMHCIDLKQTLDEKAESMASSELSKLAHGDVVAHNVYSTYDTGVLKCSKTDLLKHAINYPKQTNEHNALDDAEWNMGLFNFLKSI